MNIDERDEQLRSQSANPIPTDLPKPPDYSKIPSAILHSGTVETLIGQNDDLMARLKVNIRRNSVLEQQILEGERICGELQRTNSSLLSQLQILREKDSILRDKNQRTESLHESLRGEIEVLNKHLLAREDRISHLIPKARFERRIKKWVRPMVDALRAQLANERKTVFAKEAIVSDLRARLAAAVEHSQGIERQMSRDQNRLVEQYELAQKATQGENDKLKLELKLLREKSAMIDQAIKNEAQSQNHVIQLERQMTELKAQLDGARREARALGSEKTLVMRESQELSDRAEDARVQLDRVKDQFESLQILWLDSKKKLDSVMQQNETLNHLNQELSRQIGEQRKALDSGASRSMEC